MVHLPPEDLVDGGALLERALGHHLGPHLLQHHQVSTATCHLAISPSCTA